MNGKVSICVNVFFFFQAEDGIRDLVRSRGLGDVYKRQAKQLLQVRQRNFLAIADAGERYGAVGTAQCQVDHCLLYTSDAADERSSVDLGGRRIIKKKKQTSTYGSSREYKTQK